MIATKSEHPGSQNKNDVRAGDVFTFVRRVNGRYTELRGVVEVVMPPAQARKLGLTQSKRQRTGMLLRVKGFEELIYKDVGQVKSAHKPTANERVLDLAEEVSHVVLKSEVSE